MSTIQVPADGKGCLLYSLPSDCPHCFRSILPEALVGRHYDSWNLEVFMQCPHPECKHTFIAFYDSNGSTYQYSGRTSLGRLRSRNFNKAIADLSSSFEEIYNQAYSAEQHGLNQICGVGYRKALEFLIKDYAISRHPSEEEVIKKKLLGKCVEEYVASDNIKKVAKRAAWLGNDETHYIRKWEGKDLKDMKVLIDLTIHWIEMEILTSQAEADMPEVQ